MEPKDKIDVISIVGMAGLGKTTLAWKVYNSERIQYEFPIRIWINVSQKFKMRDILVNILRSCTLADMSGLSDGELEQEVGVCLKDECFLIVLDDVWSVEDWRSLERVLTVRNSRGKVMITSDNMAVGEFASRGRQRPPYQLPFRSLEQSWELLQLEVFGDFDICPQELREVGHQIANNCNGLPLTIVVVGGILASQSMRQRSSAQIRADWLKVSENVTDFNKDDHIRNIVGLSYDALPDELRDCFLYIGVFPEDYDIPAWTLTRLWIAEGFIQNKVGESLEETAEMYLNDLINRNLLMAGRTSPTGKVKTCRVHDAVRAFCTSKAAELELFHEIKFNPEQGVFETPRNDYRRLCIHSQLTKFLSERGCQSSARSFLCFHRDPVDLAPEHTTAIPDAFRLLRVLDSKSVRLNQFPPTLTNMIHLRYVTLYVHELKVVPEPIAWLWNLQTLVVDTRSDTLSMRANIWRMIQLRHLETKAAIVLDHQHKWEGGAGENLQTLATLSPGSFNETVSTRASYLKKLRIRGRLANLPNPKLLGKLGRLENLKLVNDKYYESEDDEVFRLPKLDYFPPNLKMLTLAKTKLDWVDMSAILARINTLEVLKLKDNAFTGITWEALGPGFPSLQFLLIADADLVVWESSADHFPRLTHLSLSNCENLTEIPEEVATNLQKLQVDRLRPSAVESAKNIQIQKEQDQPHKKLTWSAGFQLSVGPGCVITE